MSRRLGFEVLAHAAGSRARLGRLQTARGITIETPVFMPVGTRASVRTQPLSQLERLAPSIILGNTYHLMVRPGIEVFERFGGLHAWMGWKQAILTDSGGFQVFSLAAGCRIDEHGAELRSPVDGTRLVLTPERSIEMQRAIGSDIMMVLDHLVASTSSRAEAVAAMERTHRWAARSLAARGDASGALFAIVQGTCVPELRRASASALSELSAGHGDDGFDGFAIGGLAVGESRAEREDICELTASLLPVDRPRYLMGVGTPVDLLEGVHRGVDMFDCVLPTAWAQQGIAFTSRGKVDLRRGSYKLAAEPLDRACDCEACASHSRSYLHHLVRCKEPLGWQLLAFHNLRFYLARMSEMRAAIASGTFAAYYAANRGLLDATDLDNPPLQPKAKPRTPTTRGAFDVHVSSAGFSSIRHVTSGEVMHSVNAPDTEAERVYVAQSALLASARPVVVWDVGLGAGHNAMALVRHAMAARGRPATPTTLVSFERDLDAFQLALAHGKHFPHLRHEAPHVLARYGQFTKASLQWQLVVGDFLSTFRTAPRPDVIFYDPFSSKVDTPMWSLATFRTLFEHVVAPMSGDATGHRTAHPVELFTYSSSTAVRTSLLAAGFHVARGVGSGPKSETTIAFVPGDGADFSQHVLLGREWLERRARSTARFAADVSPDEHDRVEAAVHTHAQFRGTAA